MRQTKKIVQANLTLRAPLCGSGLMTKGPIGQCSLSKSNIFEAQSVRPHSTRSQSDILLDTPVQPKPLRPQSQKDKLDRQKAAAFIRSAAAEMPAQAQKERELEQARRLADMPESIFSDVVNNIQQDVISEKNVGLLILQQQVTNLTSALSIAQDDLRRTIAELREAEESAEFFRDLLKKPMAEIANQNVQFKATYEQHMEVLADWMVSQKAFKELAIQLGEEKGFSADQVIKMGFDMKPDVLADRFNPSHNTISGDSTIIGPRKKALADKYQRKE